MLLKKAWIFSVAGLPGVQGTAPVVAVEVCWCLCRQDLTGRPYWCLECEERSSVCPEPDKKIIIRLSNYWVDLI